MGDTYHFGMPGWIIHISHILIGLWLVYLGYKRITDQPIKKYNYTLLTILGVVLFFYFIVISLKNIGKTWNYAFGIPNYVIFLTHLMNAILFVGIGLRYINIGDIISLYLIISGSIAFLYHAHLMYLH